MAKKETKQKLGQEIGKPNFSPSEFMRQRRPELYSDTVELNEPKIKAEVFDHHLETLTSRNQYTEFEHFCRKIAEVELCPNLVPQTGPTGGGDGKVDTETHPVANTISQLWYEGINQSSSSERWAFAFSAKKDWAPKVRSDVKGIAETGRPYKLIYFISNQFIPAKRKSELQDELTEKYNIPVHILDRSWIMDVVFKHNHIDIAIQTLHLTEYASEKIIKTGAKDTKRIAELELLEKQISEASKYQGIPYQLAEDCLDAALLARALGRPRHEIDGLFARAERIARNSTSWNQLFRILYEKAWTAVWWYDDFSTLNTLYNEIEALSKDTEDANDLERRMNLWNVLFSAVQQGKISRAESKITKRIKKLEKDLDRVAANTLRPNNALLARTHRLLVNLTQVMARGGNANPILDGLKQVVFESENLGAYPFESLEKIIKELGNLFTGNSHYDELFEITLQSIEKRKSEGAVGEAIAERGHQQLAAGNTYEAISLFGRAQEKLMKHEYRSEQIPALLGLAMAYENAGLLWASRTNILLAATQAFADFTENGNLTKKQMGCIQQLVWAEIQLGRLPQLLSFIEAADAIAGNLSLTKDEQERFLKMKSIQDMVLGMLLLMANMNDLKKIEFLPAILENMGLNHAEMGLSYALGDEERFRKEFSLPDTESADELRKMFLQWLDQPVKKDLPSQPCFYAESENKLNSCVLGCKIEISCSASHESIMLSEIILSALEAFFATGIVKDVLPYRQLLKIKVEASKDCGEMPSFEVGSDDNFDIVIKHPLPLPNYSSQSEQVLFREKVWEILANIIPLVAVITDPVKYFSQIQSQDVIGSRVLISTHIITCTGNILGKKPKLLLSDWEGISSGTRITLGRDKEWNADEKDDKGKGKIEDDESSKSQKKLSAKSAVDHMPKLDKLKHTDLKVISIINIPLWDKAKWKAVLFDSTMSVPFLTIGFSDSSSGKLIFQEWRKMFGIEDLEEKIRVSIITGINKKNPDDYTVHISTNFESGSHSANDRLISVSRYMHMKTTDVLRRDNFLELYRKTGKYILLPGDFVASKGLMLFPELAIEKKNIIIRSAWEIGVNDPDSPAIDPANDPIIPIGVENPPINKIIQKGNKFNR